MGGGGGGVKGIKGQGEGEEGGRRRTSVGEVRECYHKVEARRPLRPRPP